MNILNWLTSYSLFFYECTQQKLIEYSCANEMSSRSQTNAYTHQKLLELRARNGQVAFA